MQFIVISGRDHTPANPTNRAYLIRDNWDDWGKYRTQFYLKVYSDTGECFEPGSVKIGQFGLKPSRSIEKGQRAPDVPDHFECLDDSFFDLSPARYPS